MPGKLIISSWSPKRTLGLFLYALALHIFLSMSAHFCSFLVNNSMSLSCLKLEQKLENWGHYIMKLKKNQKEKHHALMYLEHQAMECFSLCLHAGCSWKLKAILVNFELTLCKESWRFGTGNQKSEASAFPLFQLRPSALTISSAICSCTAWIYSFYTVQKFKSHFWQD